MVFVNKISLSVLGCILFSGIVQAQTLDMDVFAIPSAPVKNLVATTSKQLTDYGMQSFYSQGYPVHITLYLTSFPSNQKDALQQAVKQVALKWHSFAVAAKGVTITKSNWAFINITPSDQLQRLADEITLAASPLRATNVALPGWVKAYPNKLAAFERYGSPNVFQNFEPHLTLLAAEKNPQLAEFQQKMTQTPASATGEIIGLGIGVADKLGQQKKVLATYYFH